MEDYIVLCLCMLSFISGMGLASIIWRGMVADARQDRKRAQQEAKHWQEGYIDIFHTTLNVMQNIREENEKKKTESANRSNVDGSGKRIEKA